MAKKHAKRAKKKGPKQETDELGTGLPRLTKKTNFKDFKSLAKYAKTAVYLIVRIRGGEYRALGTGFLAGECRMVTCTHCIDADNAEAELATHQDGDLYLFIQKAEDGSFHRYGAQFSRDENLFVYPNVDMAVFELPTDFYLVDGEYFKHPKMFLNFASEPYDIGSEMAILGYPLPDLDFGDDGMPDLTNVHIRGDVGVVNTRYVKESIEMYESTTAFNPGNSGGPILDVHTGKVIGIVFGYMPTIISFFRDTVPVGELGNEEEFEIASAHRAVYSWGISSRNYTDIIERHNLASG